MLKACYCVLIHLEAMKEDTHAARGEIKKYNEIVITRHLYPEDSENVYVTKKKQFWISDFNRYMPVTRGRGMFVEYVLTECKDDIEKHIETLKRHAQMTIDELKKCSIDMNYPFVQRSNCAEFKDFKCEPGLCLWPE